MTRTFDRRLATLETRAAPADHPLIIVRRTRAEDGSTLGARVVTHDGVPTADAIAARPALRQHRVALLAYLLGLRPCEQ